MNNFEAFFYPDNKVVEGKNSDSNSEHEQIIIPEHSTSYSCSSDSENETKDPNIVSESNHSTLNPFFNEFALSPIQQQSLQPQQYANTGKNIEERCQKCHAYLESKVFKSTDMISCEVARKIISEIQSEGNLQRFDESGRECFVIKYKNKTIYNLPDWFYKHWEDACNLVKHGKCIKHKHKDTSSTLIIENKIKGKNITDENKNNRRVAKSRLRIDIYINFKEILQFVLNTEDSDYPIETQPSNTRNKPYGRPQQAKPSENSKRVRKNYSKRQKECAILQRMLEKRSICHQSLNTPNQTESSEEFL